MKVKGDSHQKVKGDSRQIWRIRSGEPSAAEPQPPDVRVNHERRNLGASYNLSKAAVPGSDFVFGFSSPSRNQEQSLTP